MNVKHYMCKLSGLAPKVKLGPLEWDMPGLIRSLLDCEVIRGRLLVMEIFMETLDATQTFMKTLYA